MASNATPKIEGLPGIMVYSGLGTPFARAFVVGALSGVALYAVGMPRACFDDEDGGMRPFKLLSSAPTATYAHFLALPVVLGGAAFLFT